LEDPHAGDYLRMMPPGRGGMAGRFNALNRDKRSLCLDLKRPEGRQALVRLLPRYDVLVESFRPGVMERLGLGYPALAAASPRRAPPLRGRARAQVLDGLQRRHRPPG